MSGGFVGAVGVWGGGGVCWCSRCLGRFVKFAIVLLDLQAYMQDQNAKCIKVYFS